MRRVAVALTFLALAATACGSTVQTTGLQGRGVDQGLQADQGGVIETAPEVGGGATASEQQQKLGEGTSSVPVTTTGAQPGGVAGPGAAATRPAAASGVSSALKPVQVGIALYPDVNEFAKQFGADVNTGDQRLILKTMVDWVNTHGGAAGHRVEVVTHDVSLTGADTYEQSAQQACEDFTVDHQVSVVIATGTQVTNNFAACLRKRGAALLVNGKRIKDREDWRANPNMFSPAEADAAQVGRAMVDLVLKRSLAKKGDTVGLMVMEQPGALRTADRVVTPGLKAAGVNVVVYTVPSPNSTAEIGNAVAVNNSAVLKMSSQGVKTAMFLCPACLGYFAQQADSQGYYPTYVGSSFDSPAALKGAENDKTLGSAVAVGWDPHFDVGLSSHPNELADNPTRKLCHTIMDPIRQAKDDVSEYVTQAVCDAFLQVVHAAELNPASALTGSVLETGLGRFGTRYPSALNYATNLTAELHGGATSFRTLHWDKATHAFVYDSRTRTPLR